MSNRSIDYIIVGQGLAGTALAYILHKTGKKIAVIDQDSEQTSSKVAAGLYNPITGRKLVRTWKANELFPFLETFYQDLELVTKQKFLFDLPIYRPFFSVEQQNEWMAKSENDEYSQFVKKTSFDPKYEAVHNDSGGVELAHSGYLEVPVYLMALRNYFIQNELLISEQFDFNQLELFDRHVEYKNIRASKIIFCEGPRASENPYFNWLPFSLVKGEILTFKSNLQIDNIVNRGVFVIPRGHETFRTGSNYNNNDRSWDVTEKGRQEIEERLKQLISCDYEVISQKAGIRPATRDRKPFIGLHPKYETIGIFNGLGTKGVSLAPYFAQQFCNYLESDEQLDSEVNISRYFSLY